jgi:disulfide bond formation protein DsbB
MGISVPCPSTTARLLALIIPAALLAGAWISQLVFGLAPCEMCHWQRWPHYAALVPALAAFIAPPATRTMLIAIAALLIAVSGAIGVFHAGVEYGWWEGLTTCAAPGAGSLEDLLNAPLIRCDVAPWDLFGISLAGFNALLSLGGAALIFASLRRSRIAA